MSAAKNKAVFLSYASQDAEAARRIAEALRAAGVEVWFDQSELRGGDAWDAKIRRQIAECALFVPVISANTNARAEGYFRLEWKLAVDRSHLIAEDAPFLLPIVIDETSDAAARVPGKFREVQWTRLPAGAAPGAFCARVQALFAGGAIHGTTAREMDPQETVPSPRGNLAGRPPSSRGRKFRAVGLAALGIVASAIAFMVWRKAPVDKPAELSGAPALIAKAWEHLNRPGRGPAELELADDLCKRATALSPDDAAAWATWSQVQTWHIYYNVVASPERRESAQTKAARALQLDPKSFEARFAEACYHVRTTAGVASGRTSGDSQTVEASLRRLLAERPNEPRVCFALGTLLRNAGKDDEALALFDRMATSPAFAAEAWAEIGWLRWIRGDFSEALKECDRSVAQESFAGNLSLRMYLALTWTGDLDLAKATVASVPPTLLHEDKIGILAARVYWWRREAAPMLRLLNAIPRSWITWWDMPKSYYTGQAHLLNQAKDAAQISWGEALRQVEARAVKEPESARLFLWKAQLLGHLGRTDEAQTAWRLAESFGHRGPSSAFSTIGDWTVSLATGDHAAALDSLEKGYADRALGKTTWAILRYDPQFDPLRNEPRFQALLARAESDPQRCPHAKSAAVTASAIAAPARNSLAVLAFENRSSEKDSEYFSDGIGDELINVLGRVPGLRVVGRTSSYSFKGKAAPSQEIGRALNVAHLIEGSVQRAGGKVRVIARLIRADTGERVWDDTFEPDVKDIFAAQIDVAKAIARALSLQLGVTAPGSVRSVNPEAYDLYARGRQAWNLRSAESLKTAEQCFNQAIALDRNFARAYVGLADVWLLAAPDPGESAPRRKIEAQIQTALGLEPDLAEAHAALGHLYLAAQPYEEAEKELRTAIRLNLNYVLAHQILARALEADGRLEEAFTSYQRALDLDPLTSRIADNYGRALLMAGRAAEALAAFQQAVRLQPDNWQARSWLAWTLCEVGRTPEAVVEARGLASTLEDTQYGSSNAIFAGIVLHRAGLKAEAEDVARRMPVMHQASLQVHAMLLLMSRGDDPLAKPFEGIVPASNLALLYYLPAFDSLRGDPRFQRLIANAGLKSQYTRAQEERARWAKAKAGAK